MFNRILFFWKIGCLGAVLGIANWLLYREGLPFLRPWPTLFIFLILPFSFSLAHNAIHSVSVRTAKIFSWTGGFWFIFTLYSTFFSALYFFLYIVLLLTGQADLWEAIAVPLSRGALAAMVLLLAYGIYKALHPVVRSVTIQSAKVSQPLTIAFLTDIHLSPIQSHWYVRRMVARLAALSPDLVLFGGDLIDAHLSFVLADGSYRGLAALRPPKGLWAVFGNHDYFDGDVEAEAQAFSLIRFLRHERAAITPDITITGLSDYIHFPSAPLPDCDNKVFNILVDHEPLRIRETEKKGYDLYLGGHTHAGQFFPVTTLTNRLYLLNYGSRRFENLLAIVSSGYGAWGMIFRTGPSPEIVKITIEPEKGE